MKCADCWPGATSLCPQLGEEAQLLRSLLPVQTMQGGLPQVRIVEPPLFGFMWYWRGVKRFICQARKETKWQRHYRGRKRGWTPRSWTQQKRGRAPGSWEGGDKREVSFLWQYQGQAKEAVHWLHCGLRFRFNCSALSIIAFAHYWVSGESKKTGADLLTPFWQRVRGVWRV